MVGLDLGICFRTQVGGIGEEISAAVEYGESPDRLGLWVLWEAGDEVLCRLAHDLRERPVLLLGDHFEPLIERIGELDLSPCHDVFYSITKALPSNCRRQDGAFDEPVWLACAKCASRHSLRFSPRRCSPATDRLGDEEAVFVA